jgi:FtsP/CotA-like multicopper oxidase with cupredoxin domain
VLNISDHALFLAPAERADVIVDFSGVPEGSKLILYNDSPAAVPLLDPRLDYYTGMPDMTDTGGSPGTRPGYGPNTRTVMQFSVEGSVTTPYDASVLTTAIPAAFAGAQDPPIVPEKAYGAATDTLAKVQDTALTFKPTSSPTTVTLPLEGKMEVEFFEQDYGRMNANLGLQLPFTNIMKEIILPFGYIDPPTEIMKNTDSAAKIGSMSDGTQIWKISHNGVDTHAIHFHLFSVQVIDRIGYDGMVFPPDPNELGWKDTVRINPFQNLIVAMRPKVPTVPFKLPDSVRLLDPTQPAGSMMRFASFDKGGNPTTVVNKLYNFGWEYVWHCHLLGHEENDMMRSIVMRVSPAEPSSLTGAATVKGGARVRLKWKKRWTYPAATSTVLQRATDRAFTTGLKSVTLAPGATAYTGSGVSRKRTYYFRVRAENAQGYSVWSNVAKVKVP